MREDHHAANIVHEGFSTSSASFLSAVVRPFSEPYYGLHHSIPYNDLGNYSP